jgi:hypothetical protein
VPPYGPYNIGASAADHQFRAILNPSILLGFC